MPDYLRIVRRAARARTRADERYKVALRNAHDSGESYAAIARAAGIKRQNVRKMLVR